MLLSIFCILSKPPQTAFVQIPFLVLAGLVIIKINLERAENKFKKVLTFETLRIGNRTLRIDIITLRTSIIGRCNFLITQHNIYVSGVLHISSVTLCSTPSNSRIGTTNQPLFRISVKMKLRRVINDRSVKSGRTAECRWFVGTVRRLYRWCRWRVGTVSERKRVCRQSALTVARTRSHHLGYRVAAVTTRPPRRGRRSRSLVDRPVPIPSFMQTSLKCASRLKKKISRLCFVDGNNKF